MQYPSFENQYLVEHAQLLKTSYAQCFGDTLIDAGLAPVEFAKALFTAPFAILSHNTEPDPVFNYANAKALELFELSWEAFLKLPSRCSAEPVNQQERAKLLENVTRDGYIRNYQGVRVSATGRRFQISEALVWNVYDSQAVYRGQAAYFEKWQYL